MEANKKKPLIKQRSLISQLVNGTSSEIFFYKIRPKITEKVPGGKKNKSVLTEADSERVWFFGTP